MQITKLEDGAAAPKHDTKVFTQEELQKEFDFILAERIAVSYTHLTLPTKA